MGGVLAVLPEVLAAGQDHVGRFDHGDHGTARGTLSAASPPEAAVKSYTCLHCGTTLRARKRPKACGYCGKVSHESDRPDLYKKPDEVKPEVARA